MIFIASDHAGYDLKSFVKDYLSQKEYALCDLGTTSSVQRVDYPDYASLLSHKLLEANTLYVTTRNSIYNSWNSENLGILVCGSGIGMSMSANRINGIRAALCTSAYMAKMARLHNDANILCLGARISGVGEVESILDAFLQTDFEGGRHSGRVEKIDRG